MTDEMREESERESADIGGERREKRERPALDEIEARGRRHEIDERRVIERMRILQYIYIHTTIREERAARRETREEITEKLYGIREEIGDGIG